MPTCVDFNPRSREGSDVNGGVIFSLEGAFQSTLPRRERHAQGHLVVGAKVDFNPRSREGSDLDTNTIVLPLPVFQSTLPRRERHHKSLLQFYRLNFNPRSREGSDQYNHNHYTYRLISIHAPAKGATDTNAFFFSKVGISIHAPAKGATLLQDLLNSLLNYFNPRSREGSDVCSQVQTLI